MSTIFVLAGSMLGFLLGTASLFIGAGLAVAMLVWTGSGIVAALLCVMLATSDKPKDQEALVRAT